MAEFSSWDERYAATPEYIFGTTPNAFLARQKERLTPGASVLSVADGEGRNGVWLAEQGLRVTTIEYAPTAIAKAQRLAQARGVSPTFLEGDILAWDWPKDAFDVVVAIFIQFTPPREREIVFAGMRRALKPGGLLLMEGYRPEQLAYGTGGPRAVENLYTRALLEGAFGDYEILKLDAYDAVVDEGPAHSGMSALIDLVARKPA